MNCLGSCAHMTPNHPGGDGPALPQTSDAPITIRLSKTEVMQGQTVTLTLEGQNGFLIQGFIVQARTKAAVPEVVGRFVVTEGMRLMNCANLPEASVATHPNRDVSSSIQLTWMAPENVVGDVAFS